VLQRTFPLFGRPNHKNLTLIFLEDTNEPKCGLTLYPLQDNYLDIIRQVIVKLNEYVNIDVQTFPTATILIGDYNTVMDALKDAIAWSYENFGKCVFVAKFLPDYEAR